MRLITLWHCGAALAICASPGVQGADVTPSMLVIERYAAERGDANAQYFLGEHHELGDSGVAQDFARALELYRMAAGQQHAPAQYKLGRFHEQGLAGLPPDLPRAREWYGLAAQNGSEAARQRLAELDLARSQAEADARRKTQEAAQARERRQAEEQRKAAEAKRTKAAPPAPVVVPVATAPSQSKPAFDAGALLEHVAARRWRQGEHAAEFLPADDMSCLKTRATEITCFSRERRRQVGGTRATFSLKAVLERFSDQGTFEVAYTYNVTALEENAGAAPGDDYGLLAVKGWQPGLTARCRLHEPGRIECRDAHDRPLAFNAR